MSVRSMSSPLTPVAGLMIGWSVGLCELGAELLALRDGSPGTLVGAAAASCLQASGIHAALAEALAALPGAPSSPTSAPELERLAGHTRAWIAGNLAPASTVLRSATIGIAGSQLVRAATSILALPDPRWIPHLRLDPLERSRLAASDGITHLALTTGYEGLPPILAQVAASLHPALSALRAPAVDFAQLQALAHSLARAWTGYPWSAQLRQALALLPADGGAGASLSALPPGSSPAPIAPPAPAPVAPPAAPPPAAAPEPTVAPAPPPPIRRRLLPPEPRRPLRDVLARFARKEVAIDAALRALIEHDGWLVHASIGIDPAQVKDGRVEAPGGIVLLGPGDRPDAGDAWIFSDDRATAAILEKVPDPGLGPHLRDRPGFDVFPRLMAHPGVEKIRVNPGSDQEHTFFLERDAYGVVKMMCDAIAFERLAAEASPREPAFRAALLALPGLATLRFREGKAFHSLAGDWAPPFAKPAVAFTTPDVARGYLQRLTVETQAKLEQVVPSAKTLLEVILEETELDGLVIDPFGPNGTVHLSRDDMRSLTGSAEVAS